MPRKSIHLTDGGPLYHPQQPFAFHPALRVAAHLLDVAHQLNQGLFHRLRDDVLPRHPPTLRFLLSPRLALSTSNISWSGSTCPRGVQVTLDYVRTLATWADDHHLLSPWILEVLLLTLAAWHSQLRDQQLVDPSDSSSEAKIEPSLPGPWIEMLTSDRREADVGPLLRLTPEIPLIRRHTLIRGTLTVDVAAWNPESEPYDEFKRRLLRTASAAASDHRSAQLASFTAGGSRRPPLRITRGHVTWLARRQLGGWRPSQIARRYRVGVSTVHDALSSLSRFLALPLRSVPTGRPDL